MWNRQTRKNNRVFLNTPEEIKMKPTDLCVVKKN